MERARFALFWWAYVVVLALAAAMVIWGARLAATGRGSAILVAGCLAVLVVLAAGLVVLGIHGLSVRLCERMERQFAPVNERLEQISVLLNTVTEQQLISERAKAIAFRDREREALRRAIREEITRKDWDAALALAGEMERVFGYQQEADQLRAEIQSHRDRETRRLVSEAMANIERFCGMEQWTFAMREAERVMKMFPGDELASGLAQHVELRRQQHKRNLIDRWNQAVASHDIDGSIEVLKKLDLYLTPQEAQAFQDTARQVFKDKLSQLGQQFTQAVREHRWQDAVRLGQQIMTEFPNSRMAQEVRERIDLLHERASAAQPAPAAGVGS